MFCWPSKHSGAGPPPLSIERNKPIVCYVTDRKTIKSDDPDANALARIRAAIAAGVDWVEIREKDLPGKKLLGLVRQVVSASLLARRGAAEDRVRILVNDRLDVALAAAAAGVHLGRTSAPAQEVVRWCRHGNAPPDFLVGVSCHNSHEAVEAATAGASYVFFGPVFDTPSKRRFGAPQGVERLKEVCQMVHIPVVAIGGVDEENAAECIRAGAAGVAAIRLFQRETEQAALGKIVALLHRLTL
jgi:thiamine-phosphate pyrophosphorylase